VEWWFPTASVCSTVEYGIADWTIDITATTWKALGRLGYVHASAIGHLITATTSKAHGRLGYSCTSALVHTRLRPPGKPSPVQSTRTLTVRRGVRGRPTGGRELASGAAASRPVDPVEGVGGGSSEGGGVVEAVEGFAGTGTGVGGVVEAVEGFGGVGDLGSVVSSGPRKTLPHDYPTSPAPPVSKGFFPGESRSWVWMAAARRI